MNDLVRQLPLFAPELSWAVPRARRPQQLDPAAEAMLVAFVAYRRDQGAASATARGEAAQLRSLCHATGAHGRPMPLTRLLTATDALAAMLAGLGADVSVSTNRLRLRALGWFAQFCEDRLGRPSGPQLDLVYRKLPARRPASWNHTGVVLGGTRGRRTRMGPTMLAKDLAAAVAAGPRGSGYREVRDRALLALACYTGLRIAEVAALRWEQIEPRTDRVVITVMRAGEIVRLPGYGVVPIALTALAAPGRRIYDSAYTLGWGRAGPVFRGPTAPSCALTERQAFAVIKRALTAAGFPLARRADVKRAFLHHLCAEGLSDHEAMLVAGIRDARTFDRLMERVQRLNAQRTVEEHRAGLGDGEGGEGRSWPGTTAAAPWPPA